MYIPLEIQTRIIKKATLLELLDYFKIKLNKQKLMFSLLVNSHCCCCGENLPFFTKYKPKLNETGYYSIQNTNYYGTSRQYFYALDFLSSKNNLYYEGKFCSKRCWKRLNDYQQDTNIFPPFYQVHSINGFFEKLNKKYSNVWNRNTDIGLLLF